MISKIQHGFFELSAVVNKHGATELLQVLTIIEVDCEHLGDHGMRLLARQNCPRQTKTDKCLREKPKQNTQKIVGNKAAFYDKKINGKRRRGKQGQPFHKAAW